MALLQAFLNKNELRNRVTLMNPRYEPIQVLNEAFGVIHRPQLVDVNELEFSIPYYLGNLEINPNFDLVRSGYVIEFEQVDENDVTYTRERYKIRSVTNLGGDDFTKQVFCYSLEYTLTKKIINNLSGVKKLYRTPAEIAAYTPTTQYPTLQDFIDSGILNIVTSLSPSWSVGTIDSGLENLFRDIILDSKSILDFLLNDIRDYFDCVFEFDTVNKTISARELSNTGSNNGLYITEENYIRTFSEPIDLDEVVTQLRVFGRDNISINSVNPTGQSYITDLSYFRNTTFMSQSLIDALTAYDAVVQANLSQFQTLLTNLNTFTTQLTTAQNDLTTLQGELAVLQANKNILIQQDAQGNVPEYSASTTYNQGDDVKFNNQFYTAKQTTTGNDPTNTTFWDSVNQLITDKETEITNKETEITTAQSNITTTNASIATLNNTLAIENNLTSEQIEELDEFILIREYRNDAYTDAQDLYDSALEIISRINTPPLQFTIDIVDLFKILDDSYAWDKIRIGDVITIEHRRFGTGVEVRLIGFEHDYDNDSLLLVFSNKTNLNDP